MYDSVANHVDDVILADAALRLGASAVAKLLIILCKLAVDAGNERAFRHRDSYLFGFLFQYSNNAQMCKCVNVKLCYHADNI
jgi:hypothetical protein